MSKALIILAEGFEEMEAAIPYDLMQRAGIEVTLAGLTGTTVSGAHGLQMVSRNLADVDSGDFDLILLPGGLPGAKYLAESPAVREIIRQQLDSGKTVAAICAAPALVLAEACDVVRGKTVCGYPGTEDVLEQHGARVSQEDVVQDGQIITGRGPGAAAAFALQIIAVMVNRATADEVGRQSLFLS